MANIKVTELTANQYVFLTLGAGLTLQKNDKVIMKADLARDTLRELGAKVAVSDTFDVTFVDGDVAVDPTNTITSTAHGMTDGDPVRFSTDGALPVGLLDSVDYYVVNSTVNDFQVSLEPAGAVVQITSAAGGGTHTYSKLRERLKFSNFEIVKA